CAECQRDRADRVGRVAYRGQLLVHDALGDHAAAVTAERFGEQRAGEPGLPDQLEVRPGHLAQEAPPLRAGLVLCLDLLDAPMGRGRLRQDLALGERPRLLHQLELGRRVEEGLPGEMARKRSASTVMVASCSEW